MPKFIGLRWGRHRLREQTRLIEALATDAGAELVELYTQTDVSRTSPLKDLREAILKTQTEAREHDDIYLVVSDLNGKTKLGLNRNVRFLSLLRDRGVRVLLAWNMENTFADGRNAALPTEEIARRLNVGADASELVINGGIIKAEQWTRQHSENQKRAMAKRRKRKLPIGAQNPNARNLTKKDQLAGGNATRQKAIDHYANIAPIIQELHANEKSNRAIAEKLNELGHKTRNKKEFTHVQVALILNRISQKP